MFADLYAVARHTPLTLIITPQEGGRLQIIVMPKPTGDAADQAVLAKPFKAIGTPEELEVEFPAACGKYTQAVNELRTALDLPLDALEEATKKAVKKDAAKADKEKAKEDQTKARSEAAKKGAATRAAQAVERKKARAAKEVERKRVRDAALKKRRDATAARKAAKPASKIKLPGATTAPAPKPATAAKPAATSEPAAARHLASKPGKAECIADYCRIEKGLAKPPTRRYFIKRAQTGRRYEKLWKNWEAFVAEANAQQPTPAERAQDFAVPGDVINEHGTIIRKPGKEVLVPPLKTVDEWPFKGIGRAQDQPEEHQNSGAAQGQSAEVVSPSSSTAAEPAALEPDERLVETEFLRPGAATDGFNHVFDAGGTYLSSITTKPKVGEHIALTSQPYLLRATEVIPRPDGGLDVIVVSDPEETRRRAEAVADSVRAHAVAAAEPKFRVRTEDGEQLYTYQSQPEIGERLEIPGRPDVRYRVLEHHGPTSIAREELLGAMKILDPEGADLNVTTHAIYSIGDRVEELAPGDWRVVVVTGAYYMARRTDKPRVKGPAATAAPATEGAASA